MAATEAAALSVFSTWSSSSTFLKRLSWVSYSAPSLSLTSPYPLLRLNPTRKPCFALLSSTEEAQSLEPTSHTKIVLFRLPFSLTAQDIKTLLAECGSVIDAQIVTQRDGKSRGFGFVTMSTPEEAQTVIDKFDSQEVGGRVIRVAKKIHKPNTDNPDGKTGHMVYVSNLSWKVRAEHLRAFFSPDFNPVSVKIAFERIPYRRAAGYGFVKFATQEEADGAISALDGKPLMDRPLRLKLSDPNNKKKMEEEGRNEIQSSDW